MSSLLISLLIGCQAMAGGLPPWIVSGVPEDVTYQYLVCSQDGLDPEYAKLLAENKCLASAAKLGGVTVTLKQKTIDSATGVDSSEEAEIIPIERSVKCDFIKRYMQEIEAGYRVWLLCRIKKSDVKKQESPADSKDTPNNINGTMKYKKAVLYVTSVPTAEKIIIDGTRGPRVIDVVHNPQNLELREGDSKVTVKKHKYRQAEIVLDEWENGASLSKIVILEQEL